MTLGFNRSVMLKSGYVPSDYALFLDAGNSNSYDGTGTTWYDLSDNNYNFNVRASDYTSDDGGAFIFSNNGIAVRSTDVPLNYTNTTFVIGMKWRNTGDTNWRTVTRGNTYDHQIMVQNSSVNLGMYDNNGGNFLDSGYNIDQTPNWDTKYNIHTWEFGSSSPYYVYYENGVQKSTITDSRAAPNNGFRCIGAYHNGQNNTGNSSQQAGDIGFFIMYHRFLSAGEKTAIFLNYRARFGL